MKKSLASLAAALMALFAFLLKPEGTLIPNWAILLGILMLLGSFSLAINTIRTRHNR